MRCYEIGKLLDFWLEIHKIVGFPIFFLQHIRNVLKQLLYSPTLSIILYSLMENGGFFFHQPIQRKLLNQLPFLFKSASEQLGKVTVFYTVDIEERTFDGGTFVESSFSCRRLRYNLNSVPKYCVRWHKCHCSYKYTQNLRWMFLFTSTRWLSLSLTRHSYWEKLWRVVEHQIIRNIFIIRVAYNLYSFD